MKMMMAVVRRVVVVIAMLKIMEVMMMVVVMTVVMMTEVMTGKAFTEHSVPGTVLDPFFISIISFNSQNRSMRQVIFLS